MNNREDILNAIRHLLVEMFELDEEAIIPEARLKEDLDFDSIDAVDMVVKLKELTGKAVKPEDFKTARTVGDVVDVVDRMISA